VTTKRSVAAIVSLAVLFVPAAEAGARHAPRIKNLTRPAIKGKAIVGSTLTASRGKWSGTPGKYAYRWLGCNAAGRSCKTIAGASSTKHRVTARDLGHKIKVTVKASTGSRSATVASKATAVVTAKASAKHQQPPSNTAAPAVSGTAQVGQTLSSTAGTWSGTTPMTYRYQWQDCNSSGGGCASISGATASAYTLVTADQGHTVRTLVTATNRRGSASAASAVTAAVQAASTSPPPPPPPPSSGLHVSGNELLDAGGNVVHLHGVNYSGTEYACVQGWGIFDGPSDQAMVNGLKSWHVNIVRIPLNEDCWLNINGVPAAYAGANYRNAIVTFVNLLNQNGIYAELSLIWAAPGTQQATDQPAAPDADHSPAMWSSMAATFKGNPDVLLAPWGETTTSWSCFMQTGCSTPGYQTASMQQAVNLMRQAGYGGPISIPCIDYANQCANYLGSSWLASHPSDPDNQLVAEAHIYGKNACDTTSCFNTDLAPLAQQYPLVFGETGETYDASDCGSSYISTFLNWADAHGVGYETWTWTNWGNCSALISDYSGTPANTYGQWVHDHYVATWP
jgi:hypothetical protein